MGDNRAEVVPLTSTIGRRDGESEVELWIFNFLINTDIDTYLRNYIISVLFTMHYSPAGAEGFVKTAAGG